MHDLGVGAEIELEVEAVVETVNAGDIGPVIVRALARVRMIARDVEERRRKSRRRKKRYVILCLSLVYSRSFRRIKSHRLQLTGASMELYRN
jgi:hypothetical protein